MLKLNTYQMCMYSALICAILIIIILVNAISFIQSYNTIDTQSLEQSPLYDINIVYDIDCDTEVKEGDIILAKIFNENDTIIDMQYKIYNPFGEWQDIHEMNIYYQLQHGSRLIKCKQLN